MKSEFIHPMLRAGHKGKFLGRKKGHSRSKKGYAQKCPPCPPCAETHVESGGTDTNGESLDSYSPVAQVRVSESDAGTESYDPETTGATITEPSEYTNETASRDSMPVSESGYAVDNETTFSAPMNGVDVTMGGFLDDLIADNKDKLLSSVGSGVAKYASSDKGQQLVFGVADKLLSSFVPSDPRAAKERVTMLATTAAQAGGKALATQAKGELSTLQNTLETYMPYIKPAAFTVAGLLLMATSAIIYKSLK